METDREKRKKQQGLKWGFADPCEVVVTPMTKEERKKWFGTWQCGAVLNEEETWLDIWKPPESEDDGEEDN